VRIPREGEPPAVATAPQPSNAGKPAAKSGTKKSSSKSAATESSSKAKAPEDAEKEKSATPPTPPAETQPANAAAPVQEEATIPFARPVPGRRGMVYPPGVEEIQANMIDVSDMTPGQLARDPRTGKKFRVP
jgi:hypothetical protein